MRSDSEGYDNRGVRPMASWGFIAQFFLMENHSIMTGFNVNYLGAEMSYPSAMDVDNDTIPAFGTLNRRYKLQYIEIPLVLRMKANINEQWNAFGKIGLGTGFNIRARGDDVFTYNQGEIEKESDISEEVKLIRQSFIIGGGMEYVLKGSTALFLDITFNNGFIDILSGANIADPSIDQKATVSFLELSVGIVF